MLRKKPDRPRVVQPPAVLRCLAGIVAALAAVGVGHGVAGLINPVASPIIAVGSTLIDAAPTPAKEFAVKTFGTYDKPILISSIGIALLVFAAVLGLIGWGHRRIALVGISLLGVVGVAAAVLRGTLLDGLPSVVAGVVGVLALLVMTRSENPTIEDAARGSTTPSTRSRRGFLAAMAGTAVLAAIGGGGGVVLGQLRAAGAAARRMIKLPTPVSAAKAIPAGAQLPGMTPFMTPVDTFYRVDIALVTPRVDVSTWSLTIDGMVDHQLTLS